MEGQTKVLITGVTYYFDKQNITLTESRINFDNAIIKDQNGRSGIVQGGLFHKLFRNFGADAIITGQNVVVLNTTKKDNPYYYGFGIGDVRAEFKGIFDFLEIDIEATTAIGTKLNIPVGEVNTEVKESFIKFTNSTNNPITPKKDYIPKGVNLSILLNMTPEAEVSIIFDEDKGDILRGTGRGNLKMDITRQGEFEVYGDYEVEQGEYLFTIATRRAYSLDMRPCQYLYGHQCHLSGTYIREAICGRIFDVVVK